MKKVVDDKLLKQVKAVVRKLEPKAQVILYGSRARGKARKDSDWDFLILLPRQGNKKLEMQIRNDLYDVELENNVVLSIIIRSKKEWDSKRYEVIPLRKEIEKDGITI